jgi:hypothetical protein
METRAGPYAFTRWAIEVGDPRQLRQSLGLSGETPFRLIREMLTWLYKARAATASDVESRASELRLQEWLASGATMKSVVTALQQLVSSGLLPAALALL